MTEHEWRTSGDPAELMRTTWGVNSRRKGSLFNCGALRRCCLALVDTATLDAINEAEQLADGVGKKPTAPIRRMVSFGRSSFSWSIDPKHSAMERSAVARNIEDAVAWNIASEDAASARLWVRRALCDLTRCVYGNPFRLVVLSPSRLTSTAIALASMIYAERRFNRLPELADALEEAGCDDADVLSHCRGAGEHVRGCWVVDLVLGKG